MHFENSQGFDGAPASPFYELCHRISRQRKGDRDPRMKEAKLETTRRVLDLFGDRDRAKRASIPRVSRAQKVPDGILNSGERADFVLRFEGITRSMFLRVETGYATRPAKRALRGRAQKKRHGRSFEPTLFVFHGSAQGVDGHLDVIQHEKSLAERFIELVKAWLSSFDRAWSLRFQHDSRREDPRLIHRNHRRYPSLRLAAKMAA